MKKRQFFNKRRSNKPKCKKSNKEAVQALDCNSSCIREENKDKGEVFLENNKENINNYAIASENYIEFGTENRENEPLEDEDKSVFCGIKVKRKRAKKHNVKPVVLVPSINNSASYNNENSNSVIAGEKENIKLKHRSALEAINNNSNRKKKRKLTEEQKLIKKNTRKNNGYKTIRIVEKALFKMPKDSSDPDLPEEIVSKTTGNEYKRKVRFVDQMTLTDEQLAHNVEGKQIEPILKPEAQHEPFIWDKPKEVVEVVNIISGGIYGGGGFGSYEMDEFHFNLLNSLNSTDYIDELLTEPDMINENNKV